MPRKDDALFVEEILDAIDRITSYTRGGREEFFSQAMIQDAVALNLIVIGEAAKNLSEDATSGAPDISWKQVAGMRNRLTHAYSTTDVEIVWNVVAEDLQALRKAAEKLRASPARPGPGISFRM